MEAAFYDPPLPVAGVRKQSLGPGMAVPDPTVRDRLRWVHSGPWGLLDGVQAEPLCPLPIPTPWGVATGQTLAPLTSDLSVWALAPLASP